MADRRLFTAFFSCASQDLQVDAPLWIDFVKDLELRVNARLVNAEFVIRPSLSDAEDAEALQQRAAVDLHSTDILIVLLTPRWIASEACRQQYMTFEETEEARSIGDYIPGYVCPILARGLDAQKKTFTEQQRNVYSRISARQHQPAVNFTSLKKAMRVTLIDNIADDIEGMIERLTVLAEKTEHKESVDSRPDKPREFDTVAHNYENVDFLTDGEVVLGRPNVDGTRDLLAQVEFVERLYVQGQRGRIEFGIRRAFLSVDNAGSGKLTKVDDLRKEEHNNCYYVTLHGVPEAVTICIDPTPGKTSLAELPLPPANNENLLSRIATASREVDATGLTAELIVSLNAEGLFLASDERTISPRSRAAITAIMEATRNKAARLGGQRLDGSGRFRRPLLVRVRS